MLAALLAVLALLSPVAPGADPALVPQKIEICSYVERPNWWTPCTPGPFTLAGGDRELVMVRAFVAAPTVITITFHRLDGTTMFAYTTDQRAATGWSWADAHLGSFPWEITVPGTYTVDVSAAGGTTTMSFEVVK